jgi:hypothetical protein
MKATPSKSIRPLAAALALSFGAGLLLSAGAYAQERREEHRGPERGRFEPYHTPHMYFDNRYSHGHYYPAFGYSVSVLPPGYLSLSFGPRHLYFHGGVWFEPRGPGFVVVRPPFGVVVPILPPAYSTVYYGGVPYYYADDIYYTAGPGGYVVTNPPPNVEYTEAQPAPSGPAPQQYSPPPPQPSQSGAPPAQPGVWYFCDSNQSYYPYVQTCKEGWRSVPANPPQR